MPKKKTTEVQDRAALQAWLGKRTPKSTPKPGAWSVEMRAAVADEFMRLHHALRSRGALVVIPNDDEPDHPGWRVVSITEGEGVTVIMNITRADQHWTDRPYPDRQHLTRGGAAGWEWFSGQVPVAASSRMWRDILAQANVPRHALLADA